MKELNDDMKVLITYALLLIAIGVVLYDITYNPQYGRKCELSDQFGNKITGNCSFMIGYYNSQESIADYLNLVERLAINNGSTTTTSTIVDCTTTTLPLEQMIKIYCPTTTETTTTTYKLKEQGSFSEHHPTTTTTTTLPEIYDFMLTCANDSDCTLTSGCCPCTAGGKVITMNKVYVRSWKESLGCHIGIRCVGSMKPCENYKAVCENKTCTKTIQ